MSPTQKVSAPQNFTSEKQTVFRKSLDKLQSVVLALFAFDSKRQVLLCDMEC